MITLYFDINRLNASTSSMVFYDKSVIGTNLNSEYVPLYSMNYRQEILGIDRGYMYFKPRLIEGDEYYTNINTYGILIDMLLTSSLFSGRFTFTSEGEEHNLYVQKGYVMSEKGEILLIIGMKDYITNEGIYDNSKLKVFIAWELVNDPLYKTVWRNFEKLLISDLQESKIVIEYLPSSKIDEKFYNALPKIRYKSVEELNEIKRKYHQYMSSVTLFDNGDFFIGSDYVPVPLLKPGFSVHNLKTTDPRFQCLLWSFVDHDIYNVNESKYMSFAEMIELAEKLPQFTTMQFNAVLDVDTGQNRDFVYSPMNHTIEDMDERQIIHLTLSNANMYELLSQNMPQTLWNIQNYVNFTSWTLNDSYGMEQENDTESADYWSSNLVIPEELRITADTPPEAIG